MNVSTLHIGGRGNLSPHAHLCLFSFARKGYAVNLYTYNLDCGAPSFVTVRSASEILPEYCVFENAHEKGSFSMFSNLFRYSLLSRIDTTWIDTDVILLADELPSGQYLYGFEDDCRKVINGAILKAPRVSPLLRRLVRECRGEPETLVWGKWGPQLLTRVVQEMGLTSHARSAFMLYPLGWRDALAPFSPSLARKVEAAIDGATTLHLWNEIQRRYLPGHPHKAPPSGSYLAGLVKAWKLSHLFGPAIDEDDLRAAEKALLASHPNAVTRRRFPLHRSTLEHG